MFSDTHERRLAEAEEALAAEFGADRVRQLVCDVTDEAQVQALLDAADEFGGVDVMVNNAGLGGTASVLEMTDEQWSKVLDITLTGTFRCVRAAGQRFVAAGKKGVIVNNASVIGWRAQEGQAHYAAAKAGVMALTRCAAIDLAPHGIRVNAVSPSLAMHPFLAKVTSDELLAELKQREAFGRAAEPWEVANVMVFLASDYASYMTGEVVAVSQPAGVMTAEPTASRRAGAARHRRAAVRREGLPEHHGPRHRRRGRHPVRQPLPPLRLQGVDGRRDPVDVPGGAVRAVRRDPRQRRGPADQARAAVRVSFEAIDQHHNEVAIFQNDAAYLLHRSSGSPTSPSATPQSREVWMTLLRERPSAAGVLRATSTSS